VRKKFERPLKKLGHFYEPLRWGDTMTNQEPFAHGSERVRAVPRARWLCRNRNINLAEIRGSGPDGTVLVRDLEQINKTESAILPDSKSRASSLARRMAERKGIALDSITGTGTRGRIMLRDLEERGDKPVIPAAEPAQIALGRTLPMTQIRKVIARRMSQSAQTAPHIYFFTDVEMDPIDQHKFNRNSKSNFRYVCL